MMSISALAIMSSVGYVARDNLRLEVKMAIYLPDALGLSCTDICAKGVSCSFLHKEMK